MPFVSTKNSITETIAGSATYTGEWEQCERYGSISVLSDSTGTAQLWADFSIDAVTTDRSIQLSRDDVMSQGIHGLIPVALWFRVRIIDTSGSSNTIRLQTLFHWNARIAQPTSRIGQTVNQFSDVLNVRVLNDFDWDASRGKLSGVTDEHKFGRNPAVGTSEEDIWATGGAYTGWLTSASAVRVRAGGDVADDTAGAGAQTITVQGLDENWSAASESITLAGASASSATTTTFIRVFHAYVTRVGTYHGSNTAEITIETTGGAAVCSIAAGEGQSQSSIYTVPAGYTAYVRKVFVFVDGNKNATVKLWRYDSANDVSAPYDGGAGKRVWHEFPGVSGMLEFEHMTWEQFPEYTDLWASAITTNGSTSGVTVEYEVILEQN